MSTTFTDAYAAADNAADHLALTGLERAQRISLEMQLAQVLATLAVAEALQALAPTS